MCMITKVSTENIPLIQQLSKEIWNKVYPSIISQEQIDFMLNMMYSNASLEKQMLEQGHQFMVVFLDDEAVGFASYSVKSGSEPSVFRLNKLYLQPEHHGKGLGKSLLKFIMEEVKPLGGEYLELNVNKENPTVDFYKKQGFSITAETVLEIGHGYLMDDYIMTLKIAE